MFQFFKNKSRYVWPSTYLHTLIKSYISRHIETNMKSFYVKTTGGKEQKTDAFGQQSWKDKPLFFVLPCFLWGFWCIKDAKALDYQSFSVKVHQAVESPKVQIAEVVVVFCIFSKWDKWVQSSHHSSAPVNMAYLL